MGSCEAATYCGRVMRRIAVFTALDGTLLDARTFEAGSAIATIERLRAARVPVVPVSVMTLDEIAPVADALGLRDVMIVEGGGAIARWNGKTWEVEPCGPPADALLDVVREIEERSGANLLVYSALPDRDASLLSGRSGEMLRASTDRQFSEPFVIESGDLDAIRAAAAKLGFSIRRGRRFFHLCRGCDEGDAAMRVRDELGCDWMIALGGSLLDAEFLSRANVAILVPGPDGDVDAELRTALPRARIAPAPAPGGWAAAVEEAFRSAAVRPRAGAGSPARR